MVYLDNAATTNHKPLTIKFEVLKSMLRKNCVNPHRSGYDISNYLSLKILEIRQNLCKYFNSDGEENCLFLSGCTEALNLAILSTCKKGGHVITTAYEHNSVLRPLYQLKQKGLIELSIISPNKNGIIDIQKLKELIKENTYLIACNFTSNVTGIINDIESIGKICKENNLLFLVDGAQAVGHEKIDMQKMNIDFLSVAGHKGFYALTGIGALIVSNNGKKHLKPIKFGGTGTQSSSPIQPDDFPDGFESGTPNTTGILSLNAGLNFVIKHQEKINNKIYNLTKYFVEKIKANDKIILYPSNNFQSGVISFNVADLSSNDVGNFLNEKYKICVRTGLHCAPLVHKHFKTLDIGMVRISFSYFNNKKDIDKLIYALNKLTSLI